jgi:hypothetical protein
LLASHAIEACPMSDAVESEAVGTAKSIGQQTKESVPVGGYQVLPFAENNSQQELFGYRSAMTEPEEPKEEEEAPKKAKRKRKIALFPILAIAALAGFGFLAIPRLFKPKTIAAYVDLGARRFDPAGLGGRMVARWQGRASYQLFIDPLDPQQAASFQAVAENPPHPISIVIRLLDASGKVACQKEIQLPNPSLAADTSGPEHAMLPMQSGSGDIVQNIAGSDGMIAEITMSGGLPCSQEEYQSLTGWDFYTNFPTLSDQAEWLKHHPIGSAYGASGRGPGSAGGRRGYNPRARHLPAPIDGDDMIVGDDPLRGTIDTSGGRVFWVGAGGLRYRSAEWQEFPAPVHYRCEKTGSCVLTRENSRTMLQARLIR